MNTERVEFANEQGTLLSGRLDRPFQEPVATAIFAHCFTCSKGSAAATKISAALADLGIAVLRFDFTGLGNSDGDFSSTNVSSNVADIVAAASWLGANVFPPTLLIGHSLGGTASILASQYVDSAAALVTIGSPSVPSHVSHLFASSLQTIQDAGQAEVNIGGRPFTISSDFVADLNRHDPREVLSASNASLLVCHSPVDNIVGIDNASELFLAAKHPKSFVSLDDADHLISDPRDARYVASMIRAWASKYLNEQPDTHPYEPPPKQQLPSGHVLVQEQGLTPFTNDVQTEHHQFIADEPFSVGGGDLGPSPYDFLLTALGACTSMTIRMYADRKHIPLTHIAVECTHQRIHADDCEGCEKTSGFIDAIDRTITFGGDLTDEDRHKLLVIADKCPIHRTLHNEIIVRTTSD